MASPTTTYRMWKRLASQPGGTRLFSAAAMVRVPYFASIVPRVVRMEPGYAEVTVPKWFFVKDVDVSPPTATTANTAEAWDRNLAVFTWRCGIASAYGVEH